MQNPFDYVRQLTSSNTPLTSRRNLVNDFAHDFGWHPSDILDVPFITDIATTHLVVEHGLENTAVISFLEQSKRYTELNTFDQRRLLQISYNNLIDWHLHVERDTVTYVFNRTKIPTVVDVKRFTQETVDRLRSEIFEQVIGKKPNPNIPALDDALIETISYWKRELAAQIGEQITNEHLSAFFNALIFVRAIEDHRRKQRQNTSRTLMDVWNNGTLTLQEAIFNALQIFNVAEIPSYLVNTSQLSVFNRIDRTTIGTLFSDFYRNKFAPYEYDFSLMSKHALSRVYEHYVSILSLEDRGSQLTLPLFPQLPEEERNKAFGSIYTPQFIARFFAKFLQRELPPSKFRTLKAIDPAVGSGIFLRTLLELQFESIGNTISNELVEKTINNVYGIDFDENAVQATRLSLSLLNLVLSDTLPDTLNIWVGEAIDLYQQKEDLHSNFDVVIANPPFISMDTQEPAMRERISLFMQDFAKGRIDSYLAFLRLGIEMLRPGGYGLFVLPHSFLLSTSASQMRQFLFENSYIRCLADLSLVRVFDSAGIYVILLIFQKKPQKEAFDTPSAVIVKCQELVGKALQDVIDGRQIESNVYSIYNVEQRLFSQEQWIISPPTEARIERKLADLPQLHEFMEVHQGFVSGADDIFIISTTQIPRGEEAIYVQFLPDRDIPVYTVPAKTGLHVFYPFVNGQKITEKQLRSDFPKTWDYLNSHKQKLEKRKSIKSDRRQWWEPIRPRPPETMLRPKIISPHLVLLPRFAFDASGKYAVSRSPYLYPKEKSVETNILLFFTAILNSTVCFWNITSQSHKYSRGYAMLEVKTLKNTRVPNPISIPSTTLRQVVGLVETRMQSTGSEALTLEKEIDEIVADLYNLTSEEKRSLLIG